MKTLVFDVSGHGFGHLAQVGCVVRRLRETRDDLRLVLRSAHAQTFVESFCGGTVETALIADEPTLVMQGPVSVDRQASADSYEAFHAHWDAEILARAAALQALKPDLLISDVPYASLAAAARLSLPALAMCSLNWRDLRAAYCGADDAITQTIERAYQSARYFLQPAPHMPMSWLRNARAIGPIGRRGVDRSRDLRAAIGATPTQQLVLLTFGGIGGAMAFAPPASPDIRFVATYESRDAHVAPLKATGVSLIDALASVDAVVTKDGYATLVEAAVNGARLLMLTRSEWPETPHFLAWGAQNACFGALPVQSDSVAIVQALRDLLARPRAATIEPTGADAAARFIGSLL